MTWTNLLALAMLIVYAVLAMYATAENLSRKK